MECRIDAGHRKEALQAADQGALFISKQAPHMFKDFFALLVTHNLGTHEKFQWYTRNSPELATFYKICKLKQ